MLSIGNKKYRNMQEQVAYNTKCIKKLDEYLDGISIQDKLVVIANDSGTFTEEELETLSMPLAFIANASKVWIKSNETSSELLYKAVDIEATEVGSAYFKIGGSKIVINKTTREFTVSEDEIITTYNKTQIDSIIANIMALKADKSELTAGLALKADVTGQAFTGAITAPSIIEDMSGYSVNALETFTDVEVNRSYVGVVKNGNKLTFVVSGSIKRTGNAPTNPKVLALYMPKEAVMDKLFLNNLGYLRNFKIQAFKSYSSSVDLPCIVFKSSNFNISVNLYSVGNLELNTEYAFNIEVTFLLSDNLVS